MDFIFKEIFADDPLHIVPFIFKILFGILSEIGILESEVEVRVGWDEGLHHLESDFLFEVGIGNDPFHLGGVNFFKRRIEHAEAVFDGSFSSLEVMLSEVVTLGVQSSDDGLPCDRMVVTRIVLHDRLLSVDPGSPEQVYRFGLLHRRHDEIDVVHQKHCGQSFGLVGT